MAKKPVMLGNRGEILDGELRRFRTKCRICGEEFIITTPRKKKFTGQLKADHGCPSSKGQKFYTVNPDHPETIHKNHPADSPGTMYEIE